MNKHNKFQMVEMGRLKDLSSKLVAVTPKWGSDVY